jgi:hypothetical protein
VYTHLALKSNENLHSRRASYVASRVVPKCEFPREFVGCSVPVLSAGLLYSLLSTLCPAVGFPLFLANCVVVRSSGWLASNGAIVANAILRRDARVASFRSVGSSSSSPSPCWLPLDTVEPRPNTCSYRRRSRRFHRGSVEAREDRAATNATTFVMLDLRFGGTHAERFPVDREVRRIGAPIDSIDPNGNGR